MLVARSARHAAHAGGAQLRRTAARVRLLRRAPVCSAASPPSLTIVTPVTGHRHMLRALRSVQAQDCAVGQLRHLVFVDGPRPGVDALRLQALATRHPVQVVQLPYAVGTDGWLGHRQYGAACFLIDTTYLAFLDEDNAIDADHASSILAAVQQAGRPAFGHTLRKVYDTDGRFVCVDAVDSLGTIAPTVHDPAGQRRFIDTNCMFIRRDIAPLVAHGWYHRRTGADAAVSADLCARFEGICTRRFSVSYVAASSAESNGLLHFTRPPPVEAVAAMAREAPPNTAPLANE